MFRSSETNTPAPSAETPSAKAERSDAIPALDWDLAVRCLIESEAAYDETADVESESAHAIIRPYQDWVIVAFRGSANIQDWITDLKAGQRSPRARVQADSLDGSPESNGAEAHGGFLESWRSIRDQVITRIDARLNAQRSHSFKVALTGHSKGGAEAMLAAFDLDGEGFDVKAVITFGQPRVGNAAFVKEYGALGDVTYRFVHACDCVPKLPGVLFGYRHAGHEVLLSDFWVEEGRGDDGAVIADPTWWMKATENLAGLIRPGVDGITDHNLKGYGAAMGIKI